MSRRRPGRGVPLRVFLTSSTTVRMYFCLFALAAAATTMGGAWRSQLPADDSYRRAAIAIGLMYLLGAGFYLLMPASRIRHRKLVHLGWIDGRRVSGRARRRSLAYRPDIVEEIRKLAEAAGVSLHSVWMSLDDPRGTVVVFGRFGRRYLELKRGMVRRFDTDRASFDYIVNHELGHLHHWDVDLVYLPGALFTGFSVLISLSFSFLPGIPGRASEAGPAAQYFGFVVVAYLARNGVLREREYHADAFAARRHHGDRGEAGAILARVLRQDPTVSLSLWERLISAHPSAASRVQALFDSRQRPYAPLADALMIGLLLTSTLPLLLAPATAPRWPVTVLLVLISAVLAVTVWRFTRYNLPAWGMARGLKHLSAFICALIVGLLAGYLTTPASSGGRPSLAAVAWWTPITGSTPLGLALTAVVSVLVLLAAGLAWQQIQRNKRVSRMPQPVFATAASTPLPGEALTPVSTLRRAGHFAVVLLALILVVSTASVPAIMVRTELAAGGVVDPFTALIVAAMACYLVNLVRAASVDTRVAAQGHRTLAMESLAAAFLLLVAGTVFLDRVPVSKVIPAGLVVGTALLVVGTVSWHAAGHAHSTLRALADQRARHAAGDGDGGDRRAGRGPSHAGPGLPRSCHHQPDISPHRPTESIDLDHADSSTGVILSTSVAADIWRLAEKGPRE